MRGALILAPFHNPSLYESDSVKCFPRDCRYLRWTSASIHCPSQAPTIPPPHNEAAYRVESRRGKRRDPRDLLLRVCEGVYHFTRAVGFRRNKRLRAHGAELFYTIILDAVVLNRQHSRLRPFALGSEFDVTKHGFHCIRADVFGECFIIKALSFLYSLFDDLKLRITPRAHVIS